jgi:four helix bundle protein
MCYSTGEVLPESPEASMSVTSTAVVRTHRDLDVCWKAMALVEKVYALTEAFPNWENFGLRSQISRAAVSVPANIAEGAGRATSREFAHFLSTARASLMEIDSHLEVATRLNYINREAADETYRQITDVAKMIAKLRSAVLRRNRTNHESPATNHEPLTTNH